MIEESGLPHEPMDTDKPYLVPHLRLNITSIHIHHKEIYTYKSDGHCVQMGIRWESLKNAESTSYAFL